MFKNEIVKLGLVLAAISLAVALVLSGANLLTKDLIKNTKDQNVKDALAKVLPADEYKQLDIKAAPLPSEVLEAYTAMKEGKDIGYCIKLAPRGYAGPIVMLVGVGADGVVSGVTITEMKETPGLGTLAQNQKFLSQFLGGSGTMKVNKDGGKIESISGATITSRAVSRGVSISTETAQILQGGKQ